MNDEEQLQIAWFCVMHVERKRLEIRIRVSGGTVRMEGDVAPSASTSLFLTNMKSILVLCSLP